MVMRANQAGNNDMEPKDKESIEKKEGQLHEYIAELEARQRNTVWPDPLRNSRGVDQLLWKGSVDATAVQRIGIAVFGFTFCLIGIAIMLAGVEDHMWFETVLGLLFILLACRLFWNSARGLRKKSG